MNMRGIQGVFGCVLVSAQLFPLHASFQCICAKLVWTHAPSIHSSKHPKVGREGNSWAAFVSYYVLPLNVVRAMHGDVMEYVPKYSTTTILIGGTYQVLYLFTCMPRDLPTRRVFLSRSHFVSFIPLSTTTCGLRPRSGRSGDALPRCFYYARLYHAVHVPLLSLTCGTSSTCRVWHPSS